MVAPAGEQPQFAPVGKQPLRLLPGQTIPGTSWRITCWLGEGNMGVVYEARHIEIDRRAAIKIVAASLADDPAAVEAFRSEARASAKIGSSNIVEVFDFAVLEDGRLMMAMEFVPGRSLHDIHVEAGHLRPDRLIGLFRQVCKGLQAAHEAGLVHRDIKPENIMVGVIAGRRDSVKLVDFGIATILGERSVNQAGTPYYMPPEGLMGGTIDGRYDIYSVGCVMYEMLTGQPPFVHAELHRVLEMHRDAPVPTLVPRDATTPRKLGEVIRRCLAKNPIDRYGSMADLEAALCEAQIEGKLRTTWDDLPLPDVDPERRAKLLAKMPDRAKRRGLASGWVPVLLAFGVFVGCVIAWPAPTSEAPTHALATASEVESAVDRIHQAAALAYFVYPAVDEPLADTAYKLLIELETLEGNAARQAAIVVREELAETLVRLGDGIWDKPGGEPFALDFYVQALMFDPSAEPARARAGVSAGQLLALHRKARAGDFTETELIAVEPLLAFAEVDEDSKRTKLEGIKTRRRNVRRSSESAQLDNLIAIGAKASAEQRRPRIEGLVTIESAHGRHDDARQQTVDGVVAEAVTARKAGRLVDAEGHYRQALRMERRRVDAMSGLAEVYFQQGKYPKAVQYYARAVDRSGSDPKLRLALGDAYSKVLEFDLAFEQYTEAKRLGSREAKKRLAQIDGDTGG